MNCNNNKNLLIYRLLLRGLQPDAEYEITEPLPNNVIQNIGNLMIVESEGKIDDNLKVFYFYHYFHRVR